MIKGLLFDLDGVLINAEMWRFKMEEIRSSLLLFRGAKINITFTLM